MLDSRLITTSSILLALTLAATAPQAAAQFNSGSDGSDGVFAPVENIVIDLAEAVTAAWDAPSPQPGKGVYDPSRWAIVFKYESVTIPEGVIVNFANHPKNPPVIWLVEGDVEIAGTIGLSGQNGFQGSPSYVYTTPGPGGFAGGIGPTDGVPASSGFGPGGGTVGTGGNAALSAGHYGTGARAYGNQHIIPLIGGSGGGGHNSQPRRGGAGGGAILIAASGTVSFNGGVIAARGGAPFNPAGNQSTAQQSCGGSGGAVRIIASAISGTGTVSVTGIPNGPLAATGGVGRIRFEAFTFDGQDITASPAHTFGGPGPIFPDDLTPRVRMVTIDGNPVPEDIGGGVLLHDVFAVGPAVTILIEAQNVPEGSIVDVHVRPASGAHFVVQSTPLKGSFALSTAEAVVTLPAVPSDIQLRATW